MIWSACTFLSNSQFKRILRYHGNDGDLTTLNSPVLVTQNNALYGSRLLIYHPRFALSCNPSMKAFVPICMVFGMLYKYFVMCTSSFASIFCAEPFATEKDYNKCIHKEYCLSVRIIQRSVSDTPTQFPSLCIQANSMARRNQKHLTCWYWKHSQCGHSEDQCKFAHHETGKTEKPPSRKSATTPPPSTSPPADRPRSRSAEDQPSRSASTASNHQIPIEDSDSILHLPVVDKPHVTGGYSSDNFLDRARRGRFDSQVVAYVLQEGTTFEKLDAYLRSFSAHELGNLSSRNNGAPPIFYAVKTNCLRTVQLLLDLGVSPNATLASANNMPVIAYAILNGHEKQVDSTELITTLLSNGANPDSLPKDMWEDYMIPPEDDDELPDNNGEAAWCTGEVRKSVIEAFNLSQRYSFWKAAEIRKRTPRKGQFATAHHLKMINKLPYHVVAQEQATDLITKKVLTHTVIDDPSPLALMFAGPSGHGKTEAARNMGAFLNLEIEIVDCTEMAFEREMFGPKAPYVGSEEGSRLNNFLCRNSGKPSIVFLDEFEKTTKDIWHALLLILDSGMKSLPVSFSLIILQLTCIGTYHDRRNTSRKIECSQTIWIMATNLVDSEIIEFFHTHLRGKPKALHKRAPLRKLDCTIRRRMKENFGVSSSQFCFSSLRICSDLLSQVWNICKPSSSRSCCHSYLHSCLRVLS